MKKFALTILFGFVILGSTAFSAGSSYAQSIKDSNKSGQKIFIRCRACHNLTAASKPKLGPNLDNIFGRKAGSAMGFTGYSKTMKDANFNWSAELLDQYLAEPRTFLPGNNMAFAGVRSEKDRKNLINYLIEATKTKK